MDTDLALILGLIVVCLSIPAMISAYSDGRTPRAPILVLLIGGGLVLFALTTHPEGYAVADLPDVFFGVVARFWP